MDENKKVLLPLSRLLPGARRRKITPHFDYPAASVGKTANFQVWYATALRQPGFDIATAVLARVEKDYQTLAQYFGLQTSGFNIIIAPLSQSSDGSGGAYHHSCISADLYCDAQIYPVVNPTFTNAFVVAEEAEVFMAAQNQGWDCGASNGEGLSRVLAEALYPGVLNGYETASVWLDGQRPDYITQTDPTDQNAESTGCAVLFLNWLHSQLNYSWAQICQAAAPTLDQVYTNLNGKTDALDAFTTFLEIHFPSGQPSNLNTDNPFPL